jgi:hypothetical protein
MARVWVQVTEDTIVLTDCALGKLVSIAAWRRLDGAETTYAAWYVGPRKTPRHAKSSAPRIPDNKTEFKSLEEAKQFAVDYLAARQTSSIEAKEPDHHSTTTRAQRRRCSAIRK